MGALAGLPFVSLFESVLPDLLLAFTFITALCYAILGRHCGKERPAADQQLVLEKLRLTLPPQPRPRIRSSEVVLPTPPPAKLCSADL